MLLGWLSIHILQNAASPAANQAQLSCYRQALAIAKLGIAVTATFAVIWAPFLAVPGAPGAVLARLVPLRRGLFEDYVANFWCATSLAIKWKRLLSLAVSLDLPVFPGTGASM